MISLELSVRSLAMTFSGNGHCDRLEAPRSCLSTCEGHEIQGG